MQSIKFENNLLIDPVNEFSVDEFSPSHVYTFELSSTQQERCFYFNQNIESKRDLIVGIKLITKKIIKLSYFVLDGDFTVDFELKKNGRPVATFKGMTENKHQHDLDLSESSALFSLCFNGRRSRKTVAFAFNVVEIMQDAQKSPKKKSDNDLSHTAFQDLAQVLDMVKRDLKHLESEETFVKERQLRHINIQDRTQGRIFFLTWAQILFAVLISVLQISLLKRLVNQRAWV